MLTCPQCAARVVACASVVVATLACVGRRPPVTEVHRAASHYAAPSQRNVLGRDDLRRSSGSNAFDVIQELRPLFLHARGPLHTPTVFVDGFRLGGIDTLREIPAWDIVEVRYLDSEEATQRFGTGYSGGVIQVITARRRTSGSESS